MALKEHLNNYLIDKMLSVSDTCDTGTSIIILITELLRQTEIVSSDKL